MRFCFLHLLHRADYLVYVVGGFFFFLEETASEEV